MLHPDLSQVIVHDPRPILELPGEGGGYRVFSGWTQPAQGASASTEHGRVYWGEVNSGGLLDEWEDPGEQARYPYRASLEAVLRQDFGSKQWWVLSPVRPDPQILLPLARLLEEVCPGWREDPEAVGLDAHWAERWAEALGDLPLKTPPLPDFRLTYTEASTYGVLRQLHLTPDPKALDRLGVWARRGDSPQAGPWTHHPPNLLLEPWNTDFLLKTLHQFTVRPLVPFKPNVCGTQCTLRLEAPGLTLEMAWPEMESPEPLWCLAVELQKLAAQVAP